MKEVSAAKILRNQQCGRFGVCSENILIDFSSPKYDGAARVLHRHGWPFVLLVHIAFQTVGFTLFLKLLQPFAVDLDAAGVGLRQGVLIEDTAHVVEQTGDAQEHIGRATTVLLLEKRFGIGIKYQKKTIQAGELFFPEHLTRHLADLLEWKNLTLTRVYGAKPYTMAQLCDYFRTYGEQLKPFICDTGSWLRKAAQDGKNILFEAQLGALRDLDYGIYPYTTSSNAVAAYATVGSGLPTAKLDEVVGVVKAYSTCVGEGPFVCEWSGPEADRLREAGSEYGAKTGRPRRVGPFDAVATRYGVEIQGATVIALTKLDVLSYMDKIPVCTKYTVNGAETNAFPFPALLEAAKPVTEYLDGWKCDISGVCTWDKLPPQAQAYVAYVEKAIGCHIGYISVGPERDAYITR